MIYLGVDCGLTGAVAGLDRDGKIVLAEAMPLIASPVKGKQMVDALDLHDIVKGVIGNHQTSCVIERVSAMPGQGVSSAFNFGGSYHTAIAAIRILQCSLQYVTAAKWKKDMGLTSDKTVSLGMASNLWPKLKLRRKDDGIAEALLLAEWLRRKG